MPEHERLTDGNASRPATADFVEAKPPLQFGRYYFEHDCGIPYERNDHWLDFFDKIARRVVADLCPQSVLDAGCAMGFLVEKLRSYDVDAYGIDVSEYAIKHVHDSVRAYCWHGTLVDPLPRRYDLITCFEVIEHMPPELTDRVLDNLCAASDRILFSSTPFDYAEPTHVNVRPPEDWASLFARRGFIRDVDADFSVASTWAVLYERSSVAVPEVVRSYERSIWRLREEARQVRETVLRLQHQLERAATEEEVRLRDELMSARDAVIGAEAGLGEHAARIAVLQSELDRYAALAGQLDRLTRARSFRILARPLRALRRTLRKQP